MDVSCYSPSVTNWGIKWRFFQKKKKKEKENGGGQFLCCINVFTNSRKEIEWKDNTQSLIVLIGRIEFKYKEKNSLEYIFIIVCNIKYT